ncbi:glycosyltransferase [Macrococcus animalis]|uniref:glycosyltransferase n=1 Tax=Macrococcus animalis TaxID=3395467 RepID=UPI0039BDEE3F
MNVPFHITGVDKASFNRLKLFKQNNIPAKILTVDYDHMAYDTLVAQGVEYDTINMYDFFQNCSHIHAFHKLDLPRYWQECLGYKIEVVPHQLDIKVLSQDNDFLMYARFVNTSREKLNFVNYISNMGSIVKHERYDNRGFLSSVRFLGPEERIFLEQYYNPKGEIVIEKHFDLNNQDKPALILLLDKNGSTHRFNSEDELIAHFIESLYTIGDHFIIDRPFEYIKPFALVNPRIPASIFLHTTHLPDAFSEGRPFKWPFNYLGDHLNRFSALICSTESQKQDLIRSSQFKGYIANIPVGMIDHSVINIISEEELHQKNPYKLISVSRYIFSKQLNQQIKLVHRLKETFPEVTLDIFGFGGVGGVEDELKDLITSLNADEYIKLRGFTPNLEREYATSGLSLFTSMEEGFALAILESYQHNTPVIGYDVKYGPNEIIKDNVNGNVIPLNDESQLYDKVFAFLSDATLREKYYKNCMLTSEQYSASNNFKLWQSFFNQFSK